MVERLQAWWSTVEPPRKMMLAALALLTLSQFLPTTVDSSRAQLQTDADFNTGMTIWYDSWAAIGWQVHPQAFVLIPLFAAVYLTNFHRRWFWQRFGYWLTAWLFMAAMAPMSRSTWGGIVGSIAIVMAIVAAVMQWRRPAPAPAS